MGTVTKEALGPRQTISLYESDFYAWTQQQAVMIRAGTLDAADLPHIAEEIESLGREQAAKLRFAYRLIAMHFLKLMFQPALATNSGRATIVRERSNIGDLLGDNPGLKPRRTALFTAAYPAARREAAAETGLPLKAFPADPPFSLEDAEDENFFPGGGAPSSS